MWHLAALQRHKRLPAYKQFVKRPAPPPTPAERARRQADHVDIAAAYREQQKEHSDE